MQSQGLWEKVFSQGTGSQVIWSCERNLLSYAGSKIRFCSTDRTILNMTNSIVLNKKMGAIVYPISKCNIIVPMAIEALYTLLSQKIDKRGVLIISKNPRIRRYYTNLKISGSYISEFPFPGGIIKKDGGAKPLLKKSKDASLRLLITSNINNMPGVDISKQINVVIIDVWQKVEPTQLDYIMNWCKEKGVESVIFVETNPYSDSISFFQETFIPLWGWTDPMLKQDYEIDTPNQRVSATPFSSTHKYIQNRVEGVRKIFLEVKDSYLNDSLKEAHKLCLDLKKANAEKKIPELDHGIFLLASTINSFERSIAPIKYLESELSFAYIQFPIENRIQKMEMLYNPIKNKDQLLASFWLNSPKICKKIFDYMNEKSLGKNEEFLRLFEECLKSGKRVTVVNYNETYLRSFKKYLKNLETSKELKSARISVITLNELDDAEETDVCIIFGRLPYNSMEFVRTSCARDIIFIIYSEEKQFLEYQIKNAENLMVGRFYLSSRFDFVKRTIGLNKTELKSKISKIADISKDDVEKILKDLEEQYYVADLTPLQSIFETLSISDEEIFEYYYNYEDQAEKDGLGIPDSNDKIKALEIKFSDGFVIWVSPRRKVPVFLDYKNTVAYKSPKNVKLNDIVVVTNKSIRSTLAQTVIKVVDTHPSMKKIIFLVKSWVYALRKGMQENHDNYDSLLEKLREKGSSIETSLSVRCWEKGYVIGPRDKNNIKLIGEIYNDQYLIDNYTEISSAVKRLRGIHRSLVFKLNKMIPKAGIMSINSGYDSDVIDEELNIRLKDFANMISLHKVVSIKESEVEYSKSDKLIKMEMWGK